jgi:DNA-binding Xre family transcriptional regulator
VSTQPGKGLSRTGRDRGSSRRTSRPGAIADHGPSYPHLPRGWLDERLFERGLTARDLARLAGLNEQTVGAARHSRSISVRTLRLICRALQQAPVLMNPLPFPELTRDLT